MVLPSNIFFLKKYFTQFLGFLVLMILFFVFAFQLFYSNTKSFVDEKLVNTCNSSLVFDEMQSSSDDDTASEFFIPALKRIIIQVVSIIELTLYIIFTCLFCLLNAHKMFEIVHWMSLVLCLLLKIRIPNKE